MQVDFDADMPVEGRNGEEDANESPGSMVLEMKQPDGAEDTVSATRKDRDQYADYLDGVWGQP